MGAIMLHNKKSIWYKDSYEHALINQGVLVWDEVQR